MLIRFLRCFSVNVNKLNTVQQLYKSPLNVKGLIVA